MKRMMRSVGYALSGLRHAVGAERNIQQFLAGLVVYAFIGAILGFSSFEWFITVLATTGFLIVELLNTAIERLADAFDDGEKKRRGGHYHLGIKQAKDTAAAASLMALILVVLILGSLLAFHIVMSQIQMNLID